MILNNKIYLVTLAVGLFCIISFSEALGAEFKGYDAEIVLDASSSMLGKNRDGLEVDKFGMLKDAVRGVIENVPEGSYVGLRVFGDQSPSEQNNCADSRNVVTIGPINKADFNEKMSSIVPRGKSCLDYALRQLAGDFGDKKEYGKAVFLITGGGDACGGDVCQTVKDLKSRGFDAVINVLAFSTSEEDDVQLKCIAEVTGGKFVNSFARIHIFDDLRGHFKKIIPDYPLPVEMVNAKLIEPGVVSGKFKMKESQCYKVNLRKGQDLHFDSTYSLDNFESARGYLSYAGVETSIGIFDKNLSYVGGMYTTSANPIESFATSESALAMLNNARYKEREGGERLVCFTADWLEYFYDTKENEYRAKHNSGTYKLKIEIKESSEKVDSSVGSIATTTGNETVGKSSCVE